MTNDDILETKKAWRLLTRQVRSRQLYRTSAQWEAARDFGICFIGAVLVFACCFIAGCDKDAYADVVINMDKIKMIESSGNPKAYNNCNGKCPESIGLYQISRVVWTEYLEHTEQFFMYSDLYDPGVNEIIADWYMNERIPQLLKHYKKPDTIRNRIICWNAGIGNLLKNRIPKTTRDYLKKYGV